MATTRSDAVHIAVNECAAVRTDFTLHSRYAIRARLPYPSLMDDLQRQRALRQFRDDLLNTPNCDECLHPMAAGAQGSVPVWVCGECGSIRQSS